MPLFGPNVKKMQEKRDIAGLISLLEDSDAKIQGLALEALETTLHDSRIWTSIAEKAAERGNQPIAVRCLEHAACLEPTNTTLLEYVAGKLCECSEFERALLYLDKVLQLEPENDLAWSVKGIALDKLGKYVQAEHAYLQSLAKDPKSTARRNNLSVVYYRSGNWGKLATWSEESITYDAHNVSAYDMLALALVEMDRPSEAKAVLERAIGILRWQEGVIEAEKVGPIHRTLGIVNFMMGDADLAVKSFATAFELSRDEWDREAIEVCAILKSLTLALKGKPRDRKARLVRLTDLRGQGYTDYSEKIIGRAGIGDIDSFADNIAADPRLVTGMLKRWSNDHFVAFMQARPREKEDLISNAESILGTHVP